MGKKYNWDLLNYDTYYYSVIDGGDHQIREVENTFVDTGECEAELFEALQQGPEGRLPVLLGKTGEGKFHFIDLLEQNTLVAGTTRSGKTTWLRSMMISLLHFSHPQYLKCVILDPKAADFKAFSPVLTLVRDHDKIVEKLDELNGVLQRRMNYTGLSHTRGNAKKCNHLAYFYQNKNLVMPYICVIFDEFADFIKTCEAEKNKHTVRVIQRLASLGLGLGINLTFATQAPYREYIQGTIKNNFQRRISFALGDSAHDLIVLGKKENKEEKSATTLHQGSFLIKKQGKRVIINALLSSDKTLANAVARWRERKMLWAFGGGK